MRGAHFFSHNLWAGWWVWFSRWLSTDLFPPGLLKSDNAMLENLNYQLFYLINATPASPEWTIDFATFLAKDLISIVPALAAILWLWGPAAVKAQRQLVIKVAMALGVSVWSATFSAMSSRTIVLLSIMSAIPSCTTRRMTRSRAITVR